MIYKSLGTIYPHLIGYYAGSDGNIYSRRKIGNNQNTGLRFQDEYKLLKGRITTSGGSKRYQVNLPKPNEEKGTKNYLTSTLICEAFNGKAPQKTECSHKDGNSLNNNPSNLIWEDHQTNCKRRLEQGTQTHGEKHGQSTLTTNQVNKIRQLYATGEYTYQALGETYDTTSSTIGRIVTRKTWIHI